MLTLALDAIAEMALIDFSRQQRQIWEFQIMYKVGQLVRILATDREFIVAGIDDDCYLDAETGAWYHVDDIESAE